MSLTLRDGRDKSRGTPPAILPYPMMLCGNPGHLVAAALVNGHVTLGYVDTTCPQLVVISAQQSSLMTKMTND